MKIHTTINITNSTLKQINHAATILKLSRTDVIRLLLKQFLDDNKKIQIFISPVKFQPRDDKSNWSTFHLTLRQDEYELCIDLRKIYKMSVSYIIAFSVKKYLSRIINVFKERTGMEITDNYLFHNYLFSLKTVDGTTCFTIYWGITNFHGIITDNYQNII